MTHDPEQLLAELIQLEQHLDDTTVWDETPPGIWMLGIDHGRIVPTRLAPCDDGRHPSYVIRRLAKILTMPEPVAMFRGLHPPGFTIVGAALSSESWSLRHDAPDTERVRIENRELMIADSLWGQESRMVVGADVAGRCYLAHRVRGEAPEGHHNTAENGGGSILSALRELLPVLVSTAEAPNTSRGGATDE